MNDSTKKPDPILAADLTGIRVPGPPRVVKKARRQGDTYETPAPLALAICRKLHVAGLRPENILEPSAGFGPFVRTAAVTWPGTTIHAVEPREECHEGLLGAWGPAGLGGTLIGKIEDEASRYMIEKADLVVGNPPFSLAEEHIDLLMEHLQPGAVLAFLLRLPFLGADRSGLLVKWPLLAVWPIVPRPSFTDGTETEKIEYGVFLWEKGNASNREVFSRVEWEKR